MENIKKLIKENKLIAPGQIIGVGVSGGKDSMALLHYLCSIQDEFDFEVVGIHVDHGVREESGDDARFVMDYCRSLGIRSYKFKIEARKIADAKSISLEEACREGRYGIFDAIIQKGIVDKIALAHHMEDQAETVLLRLFRGTGVSGAKAMDYERDETFIRPMLETDLSAIKKYLYDFNIETVEDSTNIDETYNRNFIRHTLMPLILERWPNAQESLCNFAKYCKEDDLYINSHISDDAVLYNDKTARIPLSYLCYSPSITNRLLLRVLKKLGANKDIERKHLLLIGDLIRGENGKKLSLPFSITCIKEYDYLAIINKFEPKPSNIYKFACGEIDAVNYGTIVTKRVKPEDFNKQGLILDNKKVPKGAYWRYRKEGDFIEKFGGGTVKLKKFFIEKRIPSRMRDYIPVLAYNDEVFAVAGVDISAKVKVDSLTSTAYQITMKK